MNPVLAVALFAFGVSIVCWSVANMLRRLAMRRRRREAERRGGTIVDFSRRRL